MSYAFLFPGQGSQSIGMGQEWFDHYPTARGAYEEASNALNLDLAELCFKGPEDDLRLTANQQPAILTVSVAIYRVLAERGLLPQVVAGHSLGEYSALVAAGVLTLEDAVRLVRRRGELMQDAVPLGVGAMAAVIGLENDRLQEIAKAVSTEGVCVLANFNGPGQTVLSGHTAAVEKAALMAKEAGAKRAVLLPVSAPFHSPLMAPAREGLEPMLRETTFLDPVCPVVCNVTALALTSGDAAREALIEQICGAVRWVESVETMATMPIKGYVEVGPGKILSGLVRRIDGSRGRPISLATPSTLDNLEENPE